jgi:prepilin-type N-terminal cleavage/methylation domain-containing protein
VRGGGLGAPPGLKCPIVLESERLESVRSQAHVQFFQQVVLACPFPVALAFAESRIWGAAKMKRQTGFTLIELVIVLAIILIIAAVAIPCLTGAKINAK